MRMQRKVLRTRIRSANRPHQSLSPNKTQNAPFCRELHDFVGIWKNFPPGKNCVTSLQNWNILHFSSEEDSEHCSGPGNLNLDLILRKRWEIQESTKGKISFLIFPGFAFSWFFWGYSNLEGTVDFSFWIYCWYVPQGWKRLIFTGKFHIKAILVICL